jgi:hypothetical protein
MAIEFSGTRSSSARAAGLRQEKLETPARRESQSEAELTLNRIFTFRTHFIMLLSVSIDDKRQLLFQS